MGKENYQLPITSKFTCNVSVTDPPNPKGYRQDNKADSRVQAKLQQLYNIFSSGFFYSHLFTCDNNEHLRKNITCKQNKGIIIMFIVTLKNTLDGSKYSFVDLFILSVARTLIFGAQFAQ